MKRYASVIGVRPEKLAEYCQLHAAVWPQILAMLTDAHIHNYSIYLRTLPDGKPYLFSYLEYHGTDIAADVAKTANHPVQVQWQEICRACHVPLPDRKPGEWWASMEEVFHLD